MTKFDDIWIITVKSIRVILEFTDVALTLTHHLNWTRDLLLPKDSKKIIEDYHLFMAQTQTEINKKNVMFLFNHAPLIIIIIESEFQAVDRLFLRITSDVQHTGNCDPIVSQTFSINCKSGKKTLLLGKFWHKLWYSKKHFLKLHVIHTCVQHQHKKMMYSNTEQCSQWRRIQIPFLDKVFSVMYHCAVNVESTYNGYRIMSLWYFVCYLERSLWRKMKNDRWCCLQLTDIRIFITQTKFSFFRGDKQKRLELQVKSVVFYTFNCFN